MPARLVEWRDGRRARELPLPPRDLVLGRDPGCDLVLDAPGVSRRHARLRESDGRFAIEDLGSTNGTRVNGAAVRHPVRLAPGDRIELGAAVVLTFEQEEEAPRRPVLRLLAGALLLAMALGVPAAWWLLRERPDPALERAAAVARQGVEAFQAGDAALAKSRLQAAAGILYTEGRLDDVPRADVMQVAMQRLGRAVGRGVDLPGLFRQAIEKSQPRGATAGAASCRLADAAADALDACITEYVRRVLVGLRQDPKGVPPAFSREVGRRLLAEHEFLARSLVRGRDLVPMMERELEANHMPPLLHYLSLIESGYRPDAGSPAGALGLWQLMPDTARRYGLSVGGSGDERRDPRRSTATAARYLRDLAFEFGGDALLLALAGYNRGENGVRAALKRLEDPFSDRSYWRLVESNLLPAETAGYVPRFMAAAVAGEGGLPSEETLRAAGY